MKRQFLNVDLITEDGPGVTIQFHNSGTGFLSKSHSDYNRIYRLFQDVKRVDPEGLVWVKREEDNHIVDARFPHQGRVLHVSEVSSGACWITFPFLSSRLHLQPTHPQFVFMKELLYSARAAGNPILYVTSPADSTALDEVQMVSNECSDKRRGGAASGRPAAPG